MSNNRSEERTETPETNEVIPISASYPFINDIRSSNGTVKVTEQNITSGEVTTPYLDLEVNMESDSSVSGTLVFEVDSSNTGTQKLKVASNASGIIVISGGTMSQLAIPSTGVKVLGCSNGGLQWVDVAECDADESGN